MISLNSIFYYSIITWHSHIDIDVIPFTSSYNLHDGFYAQTWPTSGEYWSLFLHVHASGHFIFSFILIATFFARRLHFEPCKWLAPMMIHTNLIDAFERKNYLKSRAYEITSYTDFNAKMFQHTLKYESTKSEYIRGIKTHQRSK